MAGAYKGCARGVFAVAGYVDKKSGGVDLNPFGGYIRACNGVIMQW